MREEPRRLGTSILESTCRRRGCLHTRSHSPQPAFLSTSTMASKMVYEELGPCGVPDARRRPSVPRTLLLALCTAVATATVLTCNTFLEHSATPQRTHHVPLNAENILSQCAALRETPGPPANFLAREESDRFEPGTRPTLIKNARIWTGARNGTEIVYGDVFLDKGVVKGIGYIPDALHANRDTLVVDAKGNWVTPGLGMHLALPCWLLLSVRFSSQWTCTRMLAFPACPNSMVP